MLQCNEGFIYDGQRKPVMSKQLTLSATISSLAMTAMVLFMSVVEPENGATGRAATAHGSIVSVLLRA